MIGTWLLENKLNRMIEMGELSKEGIKKAGKAGMFKPYKTWKAGMDEGSKNIIKKHGYKVSYARFGKKAKSGEWGWTNPILKRIKMANPKNLSTEQRNVSSLVLRHEANEAALIEKKFPRPSDQLAQAAGRPFWSPKYYKQLNKGHAPEMFYTHAGPEVVQKDSKIANLAKSVYGKKSGGEKFYKGNEFQLEHANDPIKNKWFKARQKKAEKTYAKRGKFHPFWPLLKLFGK